MNARRGLREVFCWPLLIAIASVIGLLSALFADGIWDAMSWLALAVPVCTALWKIRRQEGA